MIAVLHRVKRLNHTCNKCIDYRAGAIGQLG